MDWRSLIDTLSNKGIGIGTQLNYNNYKNVDGHIYYYAIADTEFTTKEWAQTIQLSNENTLTTHIANKNMYLINGGKAAKDEHQILFKRKAIEGTQSGRYHFSQSNISKSNPKNYRLTYENQRDNNDSLNINYHRSESLTESDDLSIQNRQLIGHNILNENKLDYTQRDWSSTDPRKESKLTVETTLSKTFEFGRISNTIDYYFDTDGNTVTEDIRNHIIQKLPELTLQMNPINLNSNWTVSQLFKYGNYQEQYYISSLNKQQDYTNSKFQLQEKLKGTYNFKFLNGELTLNQYTISITIQAMIGRIP